ncbi:putative glutaminase-like protein [Diaporthe ampelina]|uniref:Putative glutaminase-like protein n=1 Tax=Diaporthe ampelina TaxID=1214573 RepID=A0A0G2HSJ6_9PEZI|nr:putative glutaminase-like protein [Diaporthe ampelina]
MGAAPGPAVANQTSATYTSTNTVFTFDVEGKVTLKATFLSPVYPNDLLKQSLQHSYVDVTAVSADGASHSVQVYLDSSGELASGRDPSQAITWDHGTNGGVEYHTFQLSDQRQFTELSDQPAWGQWFVSTADTDGVTWRIGQDTAVRGQFVDNRTLDNTKDTNFRAINVDWPVFAFSKDLGTVSGSETGVLFTLGLSQDSVVNYQGNSSSATALSGLWKSAYSSAEDAMAAFYNDYSSARSAMAELDSKIETDTSNAGGQNYTTLTTLGVRQVFAASVPAQGTQTYLFLKEISSNGDTNTVDVIFPAAPLLFYLNETLVKLLLDPLYENQESGHYPNTYAIHDLGVFPNALGYPEGNDEPMQVEESGNMIILTLAYAQRSGDTAYLSQHWDKLNQWAGYLVNDSLIPAEQLSTDDFAGTLANQTNLALKGIIGLKAMGQVANLTGNVVTYDATAEEYLPQWQNFGVNLDASPPHSVLTYNDPSSHGLLYNIYADRLLGLNFVPQQIYDIQSEFYPTLATDFGVPLDTRHNWIKSDWELWAAAVASEETKKMFIDKQVYWINNTPQTIPYGDLIDGDTGGYTPNQFRARPVMGGMFSLLALP